MRKKIFTSLFVIACIVTTGFLVFTANAESFSLNDGIYKKILLNEMEQCFDSDNMYSEVHVGASSSDSLEYRTFSNNILKKGEKETDGLNILLPTGMGSGNNLDDDVTLSGIGCYELFLGDETALGTFDGNMVGLLQLTGHNAPIWKVDNEAKIKEFLKNFGYTKQEDLNEGTSGGRSCVKIQSKKIFADEIDNIESLYAGKETQDVVDICWSKEHLELDNYIDFGKADIKTHEDSDLIYYGYDTEFSTIYFTKDYSGKEWCVESLEYAQGDVCKYDGMMGGKYAALSFEISDDNKPVLAGGTIYQNYLTVYYGDSSEEYKAEAYSYDFAVSNYDDNSVSTNSSATKAQKFTMGNDAYSVARKFLSGTSGAKEAISPEEQYEYYISYIEGTYDMDIISDTCTSEKPTLSEAVAENIIKRENGWCQHTYNKGNDKNVTVFAGYSKGNDIYSLITSTDAKGVVERLYLLADFIEEEDITKINGGIKKKEYDDKVEEASKMDPCFSKANSVGWILCPVIEILSDTTENLYTWIEDDFLSIEAGFFTGRDQTSLYGAWSGFVGIANIILVVFFLIIVFSQLTGVGIDNYGIKKTLPKIIVAAILINLSYYICELAVDVSNILGRALNDWFTAMGQGLPMIDLNASDEVNTHAGLFSALKSLISGGIIATTAVTAVNAFQSGGFVAILLPLLAALVIALVAIFFFFILLGLRKAGVIILIAISPLAFVCYMLPNTKPLFSKWVKALKGLLILYPICGLLIGGGFYVSRMLMSLSSDYFMRFIAMMLTVVPFFFIPKLLTSSFAAMGSIGAKITSLGRGLGRRTSSSLDKGIRGTNRFKARQNDWDMRNNYRLSQAKTRRAQRTIDSLSGRNDLSAAERMRLAQANQIRQGERDMQTKAYESQFSNYGKPEMQDELIKAFGGNDGNEMMAAINTAENGKMDEQLLNALYQSNTGGFSEDILQRLSKSANGVVSAYAKEQLKRGAFERKSFSDFVNNNTDVKSDTNSLHAYQQGKGSNWVTGMNDDTLKFINSKNQHAFEANALLNAASQTQNLKELNPLNDMIRAAGITDPSMITGKMLEGMDESTARAIGGALLQDAWADIVKGNREANVSGAVRDVIDSARTASSRPPVDPRYGSSGMDESGF